MVSKLPRKQRLALHSPPLHRRRKLLSAPLSRELRQRYRTRSLPVRKGDRVKILRGDFKKLEGEVIEVNSKRRFIQVKGATITKADGTEVPVRIRPSNVMLMKLVEDRERMEALERRSKGG